MCVWTYSCCFPAILVDCSSLRCCDAVAPAACHPDDAIVVVVVVVVWAVAVAGGCGGGGCACGDWPAMPRRGKTGCRCYPTTESTRPDVSATRKWRSIDQSRAQFRPRCFRLPFASTSDPSRSRKTCRLSQPSLRCSCYSTDYSHDPDGFDSPDQRLDYWTTTTLGRDSCGQQQIAAAVAAGMASRSSSGNRVDATGWRSCGPCRRDWRKSAARSRRNAGPRRPICYSRRRCRAIRADRSTRSRQSSLFDIQ